MTQLLSASMIVKDEEENLPTSIASMAGLVDEVVLYDTGSTDSTVEVARSSAAAAGIPLVVVEGYWDDDFGRARNASLEHCSGPWILVVDADERCDVADVAAMRAELGAILRRPPGSDGDFDSVLVLVSDVPAVATASTIAFQSFRLFRKDRCHWIDRIHEQVRLRRDNGVPTSTHTDLLVLRHTGYSKLVIQDREKLARNVRIARSAVDRLEENAFRARALLNLGRSLHSAGELDEALDTYRAALAEDDVLPLDHRLANEGLTKIHMDRGEFDEAQEYLAALWKASEMPTLPLYLQAVLDFRRGICEGDPDRGRSLLARAAEAGAGIPDDAVDDNGTVWGPDTTAAVAAEALAALGNEGAAAMIGLAALSRGFLGVHLGLLLQWMDNAGLDPRLLPDAVPPWLVKGFSAEATLLPPHVAEYLFGLLLERWPDDEVITAVAALVLGPKLPPDRHAAWDERLARLGER